MHIQVLFNHLSQEVKNIIIAHLQDGAEGFEEDESYLKIIYTAQNFESKEIDAIANQYQLQPQITEIPQQNWNAVWEANFNPVIVDDFVAVRAGFHAPIKNVQHEIIITPKMSFGTGHHATTFLMMQQMRHLNFENKQVFDFGCGTGILAILAKKLGASKIIASDIDEWSITNAGENFMLNNANDISLVHSGDADMNHTFDIIVANINKNVLLQTIPVLKSQLAKNGQLLLSGLLAADEDDIVTMCNNNGLQLQQLTQKSGWICMLFR